MTHQGRLYIGRDWGGSDTEIKDLYETDPNSGVELSTHSITPPAADAYGFVGSQFVYRTAVNASVTGERLSGGEVYAYDLDGGASSEVAAHDAPVASAGQYTSQGGDLIGIHTTLNEENNQRFDVVAVRYADLGGDGVLIGGFTIDPDYRPFNWVGGDDGVYFAAPNPAVSAPELAYIAADGGVAEVVATLPDLGFEATPNQVEVSTHDGLIGVAVRGPGSDGTTIITDFFLYEEATGELNEVELPELAIIGSKNHAQFLIAE
jgi:hypothetical protein